MYRLIATVPVAAALIAGCSSSGHPAAPTSPVPSSSSTVPATPTPTPTPTSTDVTGVPSPTSVDQGLIDLSSNWKEFVPDFKSGWKGLCISHNEICTGQNALSGAVDSATYFNEGPQSIKFEYQGQTDTADTAAKLDLGHFALYFSTDAGSQFDFQRYVSDTMDAMSVGSVRTKSFVPLRVTLERPNDQQWVMVISQA